MKKFSLNDTQNSKTFSLHIDSDDKHYLFNRDNLTQPIQMQLSEKIKKFSQIFFSFLKSILSLKHLPKKMTRIAYVFPQIPVPKNMV